MTQNIWRNAPTSGGASFPPREVSYPSRILHFHGAGIPGSAEEAFGPVHAHTHRSAQLQPVSMLLLLAKDANRSVLVVLVFPSILLRTVAPLGTPIWTFIFTSAAGPSLCPEKIRFHRRERAFLLAHAGIRAQVVQTLQRSQDTRKCGGGGWGGEGCEIKTHVL